MLLAIAKFLQILGLYSQLKVGEGAGITKLLKLAASGARAGEPFKERLEEGTTLVQKLVDENRGLTPEEDRELDDSIAAHLQAIADTQIDD